MSRTFHIQDALVRRQQLKCLILSLPQVFNTFFKNKLVIQGRENYILLYLFPGENQARPLARSESSNQCDKYFL